MASKTTLTAGNLEALGAARLAALLMEVSESDTVIRRRLRMELAGAESPSELVRQIRKRLATIAGARSFVDWENRKAVVDDLEAQHRLIVEQVAPRTPAVGLDLMWRFLELANPVLQRSMDASGAIAGLFRRAVEDLGAIALAARPDPGQLADAVYRALLENGYGQFDSLIEATQATLGPAALAHVKQRMAALSAEAAPKDRQLAAWAMDQPIDGGARAGQVRGRAARRALQTIADARGDVDTFVARHDAASRKAPRIAAAIAHRLLAAGRGEEAWQAIEAARPPQFEWKEVEPDYEWDDARIAVLEALGRGEEAQAARWSCFERHLSLRHLRDYLLRLPDVDDVEAEQRALSHVERYGSVTRAILFLVSWPALDRAARLAIARAGELDGNLYESVTQAAEALAGRYPLAATLLLRAMIDDTLAQNRAGRFGHAARHLRTCASLATAVVRTPQDRNAAEDLLRELGGAACPLRGTGPFAGHADGERDVLPVSGVDDQGRAGDARGAASAAGCGQGPMRPSQRRRSLDWLTVSTRRKRRITKGREAV